MKFIGDRLGRWDRAKGGDLWDRVKGEMMDMSFFTEMATAYFN